MVQNNNFMRIILGTTINFAKNTFAADTGSKWEAFHFKSGQMFSYGLKK